MSCAQRVSVMVTVEDRWSGLKCFGFNGPLGEYKIVCVWECGKNGWPPDVIISKSSLGNSTGSFPHYTNVGCRLIHPALLISLIFFPFFCCFCPVAGVRIRPSNFANVVNCVNQTTKLCRRVLYIYCCSPFHFKHRFTLEFIGNNKRIS